MKESKQILRLFLGVLSLILSSTLLFAQTELQISQSFFPTSNYRIYDDLSDFVLNPPSLLGQQSIYAWTIPTVLLFVTDESFTKYYEDELKDQWVQTLPVSDNNVFEIYKWLFRANMVIEDESLHRFLICSGEAMVDGFFVSQSLKHVFGRARPPTNLGVHNWFNLEFEPGGPYTAMPSTHATVYFSAATVAGLFFQQELLADIVGTVVYFSLPSHNHWISDMWMGYLLGKSIGSYVWFKKRDVEDLGDHFFVYPTFYPEEGSYFPVIGFWKVVI